MQAASTSIAPPSAVVADSRSVEEQIAALRESLKNQRDRSRKMWDACAPGAQSSDSRANLGRFTEKLVKGPLDEAYG